MFYFLDDVAFGRPCRLRGHRVAQPLLTSPTPMASGARQLPCIAAQRTRRAAHIQVDLPSADSGCRHVNEDVSDNINDDCVTVNGPFQGCRQESAFNAKIAIGDRQFFFLVD
jgi:hypothetical protein